MATRLRVGLLGGALGFLTSTAAFALPSPLLSHEGPLWLGPHSPSTPEALLLNREWVVTDPVTGDLHVERVDFRRSRGSPLDVRRSYHRGRWRFSFERQLQEEARTVRVTGETSRVFDKPGPPGEPVLIGTRLILRDSSLERTASGWTLESEEGRQWAFDPSGVLLSETDPQGVRVDYTWSDGRLERISKSSGATLLVRHDAAGEISVLEGPGDVSCFYERRENRLVGARCTDGERSRYVYEDDGRLRSILWPDSSAIQVRYNDAGQVRTLHGPGLRQQSFRWQNTGLDVVDGSGASTEIRFRGSDGYEVVGPQGQRVVVGTDNGRIQSWKDPAGGETRLRYDDSGRLRTLVTPGVGAWSFTWKDTGLSSVENPLGAVWTYKRNPDGKLTLFEDATGRQTSFRRTTTGRIRSIRTASGSHELRRDSDERIVGIRDPSGAETKIERNARGEITAFVDPAGKRLLLERDPRGAITAITDRTGETWTIDRDALGRSRSLTTPSGGRIQWSRNSSGRIERIEADELRWVDYSTSLSGQPTRIRSSTGRERGLFWNRGLLRGIRLEDQTELLLQRDLHGRVRAIESGDQKLEIQRNALGFPDIVGPLSFDWLGGEYWTKASGPGVEVALTRGFDGSLRAASYGDTEVPLSRDGSGRIAWVGRPSERIAFQRDANGQVLKRSDESRTWTIKRDVRGLPIRIETDTLSIRQSFDGEGRLLRQQNGEGDALSAQYDSEGRLSLIRFPTGALLRFGLGPSSRYLLYESSDGDPLLTRQLTYNPAGELRQVQEGERASIYHRDRRGRLTALESSPSAWSWVPGAIEGPEEFLLLLNEDQRPLSATLPIGTTLWGALATQALYEHSPEQITALSTESGTMRYTLDALGRPTAVVRDSGEQWALQWNALGSLNQVIAPDGTVTRPQLGPGGLWGVDTGSNGSQLLHIGDWATSERGTRQREWMRDEAGLSRLLLSAGSPAQDIQWSPLGRPTPTPDGMNAATGLAIPGTGLVVDSLGAREILSGQRLQRLWAPFWRTEPHGPAGWPELGSATVPWWAPDPWIEEGTLATPLDIAIAMGLLDAQLEEEWSPLQQTQSPLPWLPPSAEVHAPPIGPPKESIPIDLSPLELLCLQVTTAPISPVDTTRIGLALLAPEFEDLPSLDWLSTQGWTWWLMGADQWLALP